ncbi:MAG: DeoR/GlpR transcriptional regulator [Naasia sp.]|jgi:DeoR/GlpR family transcriptional regulator of sugar metabolism|nr:DeoR/GlpR transcriptional regulator [Naasia sp.]
MRYRSAPERRARLLQIVEERGFSSTTELMIELGVSDMTVRRDAQKLSEGGSVRIVHGGVSALPSTDLQGSRQYEERAGLMATAKAALGRAAASRVSRDQAIAIDAGTTSRELARALPASLPITVVTHSASAVADLMTRSSTTLIALGGVLHHETLSFEGELVVRAIGELHLDTFYLAASGIGPRGVFCANDFDAVTKRALISVADRVVLLVDSSKFHASAMVRVCDFSSVDEVLVDDGISDDDLAMLIDAGTAVTVVPVAG